MSTFALATVTCPSCGTSQEREVATSLNAARSPSIRAAIIDQTFQVFACGSCAARFVHTGSFPYVDLDRRQLIGVFPAAAEVDWPTYEAKTADAHRDTLGDRAPAVARPLGDDLTVRCVFGLPALREKLVIADAGFDDVLVEAAKLDVMRTVRGLPIDAAHRPRVVVVGDDDVELAVPPDKRLPVRRDRFETLLRRLAADRASFAADLGAGPYVDLGRVLLPAG